MTRTDGRTPEDLALLRAESTRLKRVAEAALTTTYAFPDLVERPPSIVMPLHIAMTRFACPAIVECGAGEAARLTVLPGSQYNGWLEASVPRGPFVEFLRSGADWAIARSPHSVLRTAGFRACYNREPNEFEADTLEWFGRAPAIQGLTSALLEAEPLLEDPPVQNGLGQGLRAFLQATPTQPYLPLVERVQSDLSRFLAQAEPVLDPVQQHVIARLSLCAMAAFAADQRLLEESELPLTEDRLDAPLTQDDDFPGVLNPGGGAALNLLAEASRDPENSVLLNKLLPLLSRHEFTDEVTAIEEARARGDFLDPRVASFLTRIFDERKDAHPIDVAQSTVDQLRSLSSTRRSLVRVMTRLWRGAAPGLDLPLSPLADYGLFRHPTVEDLVILVPLPNPHALDGGTPTPDDDGWFGGVPFNEHYFHTLETLLCLPRAHGPAERRDLVPVRAVEPHRPAELECPQPIACVYREYCQQPDPRQRRNLVADLVRTTGQVLGAIALGELLEQGSTIPWLQDRSFDELLQRPSDGDWVTIACPPSKWVASLKLPEFFQGLLHSNQSGASIASLLHDLVGARNQSTGHGKVAVSDHEAAEWLRDWDPKIHTLAGRLARLFRKAALLVPCSREATARDDGQGWVQHFWVMRGYPHHDWERVDLTFPQPVALPSTAVLLLMADTARVTRLDPALSFQHDPVRGQPRLYIVAGGTPGSWSLKPCGGEGKDLEVPKQAIGRRSSWTVPESNLSRIFPNSAYLPSGEVVDGKYAVERFVGGGGMARVYRAKELDSGRIVAVKILHDWLKGHREWEHRFAREYRLHASSASHPSILQIHARGVDEALDVHYLVLEFADGGDLASNLKLEPAARAEMLRAVARGLAHLHSLKIVHRDVKPENILRVSGSWKLGDFGVSLHVPDERLTRAAPIQVSRLYGAPELDETSEPGAEADVFSFGMVALATWLGRDPAKRDLSRRHDPQDPLCEIIIRCTRRKPRERYRDGEELAAALEAVLARP